MNANKTVKIRNEKFRMYQNAWTSWVFVEGKKTKTTYSVAKIVDGQIVELDSAPAISAATNAELAAAWLEQ